MQTLTKPDNVRRIASALLQAVMLFSGYHCVDAWAQSKVVHYFPVDADLKNRVVSNDDIIVVTAPQTGVFMGATPDSLHSVFTQEIYSTVYRWTQSGVSEDGTIVVTGLDRYESTGHIYVRPRNNDVFYEYDTVSIPGLMFPSRIFEQDIDVYGNGVIHVLNAYSTNEGVSWIVASPPEPILSWTKVYYSKNGGFYAYHAGTSRWYSLDLETKQWSLLDLPANLIQVVYLDNGKMVGVEGDHDWRSGLVIKDSGSDLWRKIDTVRRGDGRLFKVGTFPGIGALVSIDDSTIACLLDSGNVIVIDQMSERSISLPEETYAHVTISADQRSYDVRGSVVALLYNGGVLCEFDVREDRTAIVYEPMYSRVTEIDFVRGVLVGFDVNPSRVLFVLDKSTNQWRASGFAVSSDDQTDIDAPLLEYYSIASNDGKVMAHTSGQFAAEIGENLVLTAERVSLDAIDKSQVNRLNYGDQKLYVSADWSFRTGRFVARFSGSEQEIILPDTTTALMKSDIGQLYAGYRHLRRSDDSGVSWSTVTIQGRSAVNDGIISSIDASGHTIIVGTKGYARVVGGEVRDTIVGGLYRSTDNGATWSKVHAPVRGEWVDNLNIVSDSIWVAWISEMELVGLDEPGALVEFYRHSSHLILSTDGGVTWSILIDTEMLPATAKPSSWSIVPSPISNSIVTNTTQTVYEVDLSVLTSKVLLSVGDSDRLAGIGFDSSNRLIVARRNEIQYLSGITTVDKTSSENSFSGSRAISVAPNPTSGTFIIRLGDIQLPGNQQCRFELISVTGQCVLDMSSEFDGGDIHGGQETRADISAVPDGLYFLLLRFGDVCHSHPILKVAR